MLAAALHDGTAHRRTTFEIFARRLPDGRRYGVVAGTGRFAGSVAAVHVRRRTPCDARGQFLDAGTLDYLRDYRFGGDVDGYAGGRAVLPRLARCCRCTARSPNAWCSRRLALSIFNHDTAIASAAARMVSAAEGRPLIEMGSRRTHEQAAVAAARAAYLAGFAGDLEPRGAAPLRRPRAGTSAHAFTLLHTDPRRARRAGGVPGPGRRARRRHHPARRHLRHHHRRGQRRRRRRPRTGRGPHRLRRPRRAGPAGARTARRPGRHPDPHRRLERPRRVRHRRAARRTRRQLTASAPRWSRAPAPPPRAWSTSWSRWTASPVAKAQQPQGIPRRPQAGPPTGQAVGHHRRGGRASGRTARRGTPSLVARR